MRNLLVFIMIFLSLATNAQKSKVITHNNPVSQTLKDVFIQMPDYREISSGSKIIVKYQGTWPVEMQGAFEHAVRIWEEVLPMTLPINITATLASSSSTATLSKVSYKTYEFNGNLTSEYASHRSMIKSVLLQEYHTGTQCCFLDEIDDTSFLEEMDISITYYRSMVGQFDFSLDGEKDSSKYDFVTVALRDIAIGLGFTTSFTADVSSKKLDIPDSRLTPYELLIMNALGTKIPTLAYSKATKGHVDIPIINSAGISVGSLAVYAPKTWINGISLRYLIPDDTPISKLLTYDFGKGYVMRDLSGINWNDYFAGALAWEKHVYTGLSQSGSVSSSGYSDDVLPFKGPVSLTFNERDNLRFEQQEAAQEINDSYAIIDADISKVTYDPITSYCKRFDCYSPAGPILPFVYFISLSVLKQDGTWDCIYDTSKDPVQSVINIEDLPLNFDESEYARGTTGGLRYRLTKCRETDNRKRTYQVKYFTRDFTPQTPKLLYLKGLYQVSNSTMSKAASESRFVDVKVGIGNVEGATRVIVEQLDEGETLPFQYDAEDFRKGYIVANLDRECSTKLTVVSYNKNGFRRSNTITIPALGYSESNVSFSNDGSDITVEGLSSDLSGANKVQYSIRNLSSGTSHVASGTVNSEKINISDLPTGLYVLTLTSDSGYTGVYKFSK